MSALQLSGPEEEELYVLLKPREGHLPEPLEDVLRRVERSLFDRLTVEELERLATRFASER